MSICVAQEGSWPTSHHYQFMLRPRRRSGPYNSDRNRSRSPLSMVYTCKCCEELKAEVITLKNVEQHLKQDVVVLTARVIAFEKEVLNLVNGAQHKPSGNHSDPATNSPNSPPDYWKTHGEDIQEQDWEWMQPKIFSQRSGDSPVEHQKVKTTWNLIATKVAQSLCSRYFFGTNQISSYTMQDQWRKHLLRQLWDPQNKTGWLLLFLGPEGKTKWLAVGNKETWTWEQLYVYVFDGEILK